MIIYIFLQILLLYNTIHLDMLYIITWQMWALNDFIIFILVEELVVFSYYLSLLKIMVKNILHLNVIMSQVAMDCHLQIRVYLSGNTVWRIENII